MRKKTLLLLSFVLSMILVGLPQLIAYRSGIQLSWVLALCFCGMVVHPLLMKPLTKLNRRLLDKHLADGRDVEAEETHVISMGLISLRPVWVAKSSPSEKPNIRQRLAPWVLLMLLVLYLIPIFAQASMAKWEAAGDAAGIFYIFFLLPDREQ